MKKEYIKPEAELMKFVETDELMNDPMSTGTLFNNLEYNMGVGDCTF